MDKKDEARTKLLDLLWDCHNHRRQPPAAIIDAEHVLAAAVEAALADTLGLLEVLRERYGTPVSIGRRFFMSSTEIIIDGVGYTRDEAQRLLAAVARPQRGSE